MTNCVGTGSYGYVECVNMANCNGFGETNTFYSCKFCSNCAEDPDTGREASWGGEDNKNIDYDTCPGLARPETAPPKIGWQSIVFTHTEKSSKWAGTVQINMISYVDDYVAIRTPPSLYAFLVKQQRKGSAPYPASGLITDGTDLFSIYGISVNESEQTVIVSLIPMSKPSAITSPTTRILGNYTTLEIVSYSSGVY